MPSIRNLENRIAKLFVKMTSQSFQLKVFNKSRMKSILIKREIKSLVDEKVFESQNEQSTFMEYDKVPIKMYQGIRIDSPQREPETVEWIENYFNAGDIFYDVGANVGAYSLIAGKYHHGKVKVYSFEPAYTNFSVLVRNISLNDCNDIIFPINIPLGEAERINEFNYRSHRPGGALHAFGEPIDTLGVPFDPVFRQLSLSTSINNLVKKYDIPAPHHIKIDVDGLEYWVLKGAIETMRRPEFKSLMVEIGSRVEESKLMNLLLSCNLLPAKTYPLTRAINYLFLRED